MKRYLSCLLSLFMFDCIAPASLFALEECPASEAVHHATAVDRGHSLCCGSKKGPVKQRRCLRSAMKGLSSASRVLKKERVSSVLGSLKEMHDNGCVMPTETVVGNLTCDTGEMFSVTESITRVEKTACGLRFQEQRKNKLQKLRRSLKGARRILGAEFTGGVRRGIKHLRKSVLCGEGGETPLLDCDSVEDPSDGVNSGNVYKLSDHDGLPVFVTHNGAQSGVALSPFGETLDTLRYTGLANADAAGPRHHYRMSRSCSSLPEGFILKIGSTCYHIDEPCSRID